MPTKHVFLSLLPNQIGTPLSAIVVSCSLRGLAPAPVIPTQARMTEDSYTRFKLKVDVQSPQLIRVGRFHTFENLLGGAFADFDRVAARFENLRAEFRAANTQGVDPASVRLVDDLDDRVLPAMNNERWQIGFCFAPVVVHLVDRLGPAEVLLRVGIANVDVAGKAFHGDLACLFVEPHYAKAGCTDRELIASSRFQRWIRRRVAGHLVVKAVEVVARVIGCARLAICASGKRAPPTQVQVGDRGHAERKSRVAEFVDAVVKDRSQVLIAGVVNCEAFTQRVDRLVTTRLGPAIRVEICMQASAKLSVDVGTAGENGLRERNFHVGAGPILAPSVEELELTIAEEFRTGNVNALGVVFGIANMIGTRTLSGNQSGWPSLELAVFEHRKTDAAPIERCVINVDATEDGRGIKRIGKMTRLGPLDRFHIIDRHQVSAVGRTGQCRPLAAGAPDVGLSDVMVIGNRDRGSVLDDVAKVAVQPHLVMLAVIVNLITREEQHVGVDLLDVGDQVLAGNIASVSSHHRVASEAGDNNFFLVDRVAANRAFVERRLAMSDPIADRLGAVPVFDPQWSGPAVLDNLGSGNFFPAAVGLDFKANRAIFVRF